MADYVIPIFNVLESFEDFFWGYFGAPIIILVGLILSFQSGFVQIRKFPAVIKIFAGFFSVRSDKKTGVHPLKAFFACVGGCVGVGNIVGICTAVQIGGPGALLWIWITAIVGAVVKYSEVYLGLRYRIPNKDGGYDGGPMYFLQRVFKGPVMPAMAAVLLCIYGVEVYQFSIVTDAISSNFDVNQYLVIGGLLFLVIYAGMGGVRRVGNCVNHYPCFCFPLCQHGFVGFVSTYSRYPIHRCRCVCISFWELAAVGGFVGSSLVITMSQGVRRGCYTGDLGVGYASIIHSESSVKIPEKQAALVIFDIFLDTFMVCTSSVLVILASGVWDQPMSASQLVQTALHVHFPYMNYFMPFFLFLLGYSTINAYFCAGIKCAQYLHPTMGRPLYFVYAVIVLAIFSLVETSQAQTVMAIVGGLLLLINSYAIYKLRHEISFDIDAEEVGVKKSEGGIDNVEEPLLATE